jgi:hypothetical protein
MAYNVIKGNVEFSGPTQGTIEDMVDDHTDQTIGGTKTFSQMVTASSGLSASIFYGDGSQLSGIASPPIDTYNSSGDNRIITSVDSTTVQGEANLLFDGSLLTVTGAISASSTISGSEFYGDATGLTNVGATNINLGQGLEDDGSNNVRIKLDTASGIARGAGGIKVDASGLGELTNVDIHGDDLFLMYDDDASQNKKFSFSSLTTYLDNTTTFSAAGADTQIQFNDGGDFGASSNLTFGSNTLAVTGSTILNGTASTTNIVPLADEQYDIGEEDTRYENAFFNFMNGAIAFTGVNDEGTTLTKGDVVYVKGVSGNRPTVALAACDDPAKMPAFGFVADGNVPNGQPVRIATFGRLNGVDTSTFSLGDTLYVQTGSGGVSGSYTNVPPTGSGNLLQNIGKVAKVDASGLIRVGGAGRTNATPNLDKGYLFIGNDSDQSVQDNTIFVSSSQNRVGINTTTPESSLHLVGDLKIEGDGVDNTVLTLDKIENSASYVEFRNVGSKYAEIFGSSAENFKIRTTTVGSTFILGHYTEDVITLDTNNTTFDSNKVTINQELVVTGTMTTADRVHGVTVQTGNYSIVSGDEIVLMNNSTVATASLPPISSDLVGLTVTIKRTGAGAVQVSGSDGIDTQSTIDITPQGGFMRVVAADFGGSNYGWAIIAKSGSF